jgi:hypothetical protein
MADNMKFVQTQFGNVHINDLPVVIAEPISYKFGKAVMFFIVLIIIILIFFYMTNWSMNESENIPAVEPFTNSYLTSVKADSIRVYNDEQQIVLENIVICTSDGNLFNIGTDNSVGGVINKFVKIQPRGNGIMYSIDFDKSFDIKEIILISPPAVFNSHVNIDLYCSEKYNMQKVWNYSGYLKDRRDNSIKIAKSTFADTITLADVPMIEREDLCPKEQYIIANENILALRLTEDSEEYVSY